MLALEHDVLLKLRVLDLVVLDQHVFPDNFDRVQFLIFSVLRQEDFTESAFAKDDNDLEVGELR